MSKSKYKIKRQQFLTETNTHITKITRIQIAKDRHMINKQVEALTSINKR